MAELSELLNVNALLIVLIGIIVLMLVFLIIVIVLSVKLSKLRKTYLSMLNGDASLNVENTLIELQEKVAAAIAKSDGTQHQLEATVEQMKKMKSNIGVYRYNAFAESGSDLSFSIAIVDEMMNGVVLSGIHNRDETYVYAKPLTQGQSEYTLSPEEKEAIHRSAHKK